MRRNLFPVYELRSGQLWHIDNSKNGLNDPDVIWLVLYHLKSEGPRWDGDRARQFMCQWNQGRETGCDVLTIEALRDIAHCVTFMG